MTQQKEKGSSLGLLKTIAAVAVVGAAALLATNLTSRVGSSSAEGSQGTTATQTYQATKEVPLEQRKSAYEEAVAAGAAQAATWPKDEQQMAIRFWQDAAAKNWDQLLLYSPGATKDDFAIFMQFPPQQPKAVGKPEPHPTAQGVTLWPVTVPFPGFPNKTVKMAFFRLPDGRLAVDGQNTIWW
jgi:hypothetical protein